MKAHRRILGLLVCTVAVCSTHAAGAQSWQDEALARGVNLPNPLGVGLSLYTQDQDYSIAKLALGTQAIGTAAVKTLTVKNTTKTAHLTADYWVLPFVDVYALLGQVQGTTRVNLSQVNIGVPLPNLTVKYNGLLYGAGAVLAYGGKHVFGTADVSYSNSSLNSATVATSSVSSWVVTPRVGDKFGTTSVWLGDRYEDTQERHKGIFDIPGLGAIPYDVTLASKDRWSYLAGVSEAFTPHWVLTLEGGFGPRSSALVHLDYRI
ncbi:MAG: hypothetical protein ABR961_13775 [Thermoanaerobaculaceae bacterium]|jgi:hypothetical protein